MSALAGVVGARDTASVERMLAVAANRGDLTDVVLVGADTVLGIRTSRGRRGEAQRVHRGEQGIALAMAGTLSPIAVDPAEGLAVRLASAELSDLDGAFAAAHLDPDGALTLICDPFGVRSLFYVEHLGALWFATEIRQLLAVPGLPVAPDLSVIHRYLTFSFVPGDRMPIIGIRALPAGHLLRFASGRATVQPWFVLREDVSITEQAEGARRVWQLGKEAVEKRLAAGEGAGVDEVGLYLSGGIDSSAVGAWLRACGASVRCFTLDFGERSVEREEASEVASALGFPLTLVPASGEAMLGLLDGLADSLDLPFGDPVTAPHALLARAAKEAGLSVVFNGEGGDQLFGGWTSKPMIAAALYGDAEHLVSPEEQYLHSYHRFYGMEDELYTESFAAAIGETGQRRALIAPYLGGSDARTLLNRVRLTDVHLKGSCNILPRAERISGSAGLAMRVPLFDRALACESFRIAPSLKLHGACEKYVLKLAMQGKLPDRIVWRRKFGMSVPVTDLVAGPLLPFVSDMLSDEAVRRRGWFRPETIAMLRAGEDRAGETRRRRLGERLWALAMLEAWARRMLDGGRH